MAGLGRDGPETAQLCFVMHLCDRRTLKKTLRFSPADVFAYTFDISVGVICRCHLTWLHICRLSYSSTLPKHICPDAANASASVYVYDFIPVK